jgi:hypothetical protein
MREKLMDHATGVRFLTAIEFLEPRFNELDAIVSEFADEAERKAFRLKLGEALQVVSYDLVMMVVRQHPDLDPDGERYRRKS